MQMFIVIQMRQHRGPTSTLQPLKVENGYVISSHSSLRLLIHAVIIVNHY